MLLIRESKLLVLGKACRLKFVQTFAKNRVHGLPQLVLNSEILLGFGNPAGLSVFLAHYSRAGVSRLLVVNDEKLEPPNGKLELFVDEDCYSRREWAVPVKPPPYGIR